MKVFVGITDHDWFRLHASKPHVEEVNFWRPSSGVGFRALAPGEPFLFKLHSPRNFIVGGGFFVRFLRLPISLAWEAFGEGNGATSLAEMKVQIAKYRRQPIGPHDDPQIGCVLLGEPFYFEEPDWVAAPADFSKNIVQGKGYDAGSEPGRSLWREVAERLARRAALTADPGPALTAAAEGGRYGNPALVRPRLGQGAFRVLVTEAYGRRCAVTSEKTLPVLEAAHIRPYSEGGEHALTNGLLLRSDLHRLFDRGYMTVDPDERRVVVSRRIREQFENGREYYALHGRALTGPDDPLNAPTKENLSYHALHVYRP